jgi:hypothetical protein
MRRLICILTLLSIVFTACEEYEADIEIPAAETKLVLTAFLSPRDTETYIFLYKTSPTLGGSENQDPAVKNARVVLSDGIYFDTLSYNLDAQCYVTRRIIESSKTYKVQAIYGELKAEAICTVLPEVPLDFNYTIDSVVQNDLIKYIVKLNWKDSVANISQTYYRSDVELQYFVLDTVFNFGSQNMKASTPKTVKGTGYNTGMSIVYESTFIPRNSIKFIDMHLFMVDEDYYKFEISEKGNSGFINYEVQSIYSNVKGGLGIVASYNNYALKNLFLQ